MGCCSSHPVSNFSSRDKHLSCEEQYLISYTNSIIFSSFYFDDLYTKAIKFTEEKINKEDLKNFFSEAKIKISLLEPGSSTSAMLQKMCEDNCYDVKSLKLSLILLGKGKSYDKCIKVFEVYNLNEKSFLNKRTLLTILHDLVEIIEMIFPENVDDSPTVVRSYIKDYCNRFLNEKLRTFDKIIKIAFKDSHEILCEDFLKILETNYALTLLFEANGLRFLLTDEVISHETSTLFNEMYPKTNKNASLHNLFTTSPSDRNIEGKTYAKNVKNYSIQVATPNKLQESMFEKSLDNLNINVAKDPLEKPLIHPISLSDCEERSNSSVESIDINTNSLGLPQPRLMRSSSSTEDLRKQLLLPETKDKKKGILKRASTESTPLCNLSVPIPQKTVTFSVESPRRPDDRRKSSLEPIILKVNLGENKLENLQLNHGENPSLVATTFAIRHGLKKQERDELIKNLRSLIQD
ncbi:unnamed protein product [Blepharisma stoltei]|uniref:Uncharacterized protein n=1 Tax=Blepharisma stoltei TaxID=1481888 RepID=A0AAU9J6D8_9CILI|nr:unnamed protein product [Blepharisma stoltei]